MMTTIAEDLEARKNNIIKRIDELTIKTLKKLGESCLDNEIKRKLTRDINIATLAAINSVALASSEKCSEKFAVFGGVIAKKNREIEQLDTLITEHRKNFDKATTFFKQQQKIHLPKPVFKLRALF